MDKGYNWRWIFGLGGKGKFPRILRFPWFPRNRPDRKSSALLWIVSYICSSVPRCQIRKMSFDLVGKTLEIVLNSKFNWEIGPQTFICLLYLPFFWINLITGCLCDTFSFLLFLLNYWNLQIIFLDLKFFKFIYFIFAHCFWLKGGSDTLFSFLLLFSIVFWNNVS